MEFHACCIRRTALVFVHCTTHTQSLSLSLSLSVSLPPQVPLDRGLISNPDLTSFSPDPTGVPPPPSAADPTQALSPPPLTSSSSSHHHHHHPISSAYNQSELFPHLRRNRAFASTRSASLSLSSKRPSVLLSQLQLSRSSLRQKAGGPPSGRSEKKSIPIHHHLPIASAQSKNIESSPVNQDLVAGETVKHEEKSSIANEPKAPIQHAEEKKGIVLATDDVMGGDEQRLRELRSLSRTRQSSLSPLPAPTALPTLPPTFNLPDVRALPTKHPWLKKKLPTISGVRSGASRVPRPSHTKFLSRATTSPGELNTPTQPKSAPSSPKPNRAVPPVSDADGSGGNNEGTASMRENRKENEKKQMSGRFGTLERRKSFSHDDVNQLQQFDMLNIGGVSPAASYGVIDDNEGAPGSQQSLVAEEGSSEEREKSIEHSFDKPESIPSDEAAVRSNSGGLPSSQSLSPVVSDRDDSDSMNQASHHQPHSTSL